LERLERLELLELHCPVGTIGTGFSFMVERLELSIAVERFERLEQVAFYAS
jgi:hypothetical protein